MDFESLQEKLEIALLQALGTRLFKGPSPKVAIPQVLDRGKCTASIPTDGLAEGSGIISLLEAFSRESSPNHGLSSSFSNGFSPGPQRSPT